MAVIVAATLLNFGLTRLTGNFAPFLHLFPAVMAAALYGGDGPGYLALGLGRLACTGFWLRSPESPWLDLPGAHWIALLSFALAGTLAVDLARRIATVSPRVRVEAEFAAAVDGRARDDTEFRAVVAGDIRWVRASALVSSGGRPRRLVGLAADVTARKAAMEGMKRGREQVQTMLDLLPVGVAISHDAQADRITVSPNLRQMLRLAPEQNASSAGPGREDTPYRCRRNDEIDLEFADGETRTPIISAAPLFDVAGKVRGAIGTHVDVTALKRAQRSLEAGFDLRLVKPVEPDQLVDIVAGAPLAGANPIAAA